MKTLAVKICTKCLSNDIRRFPHTSEVYLDWNDCVHQSRVCEEFQRRYSHLCANCIFHVLLRSRELISDVYLVAQVGFHCDFESTTELREVKECLKLLISAWTC